MITPADDLLPAHGKPLFAALMKSQPEDFIVQEDLAVEFSENGEHLYVEVEKSSTNTDEVLKLIAQVFGCQSADIGVAGLKDRHAQTSQWFSVRTPKSASVLNDAFNHFNEQAAKDALVLKSQVQDIQSTSIYIKRLRLLKSCRHSRKLKRGAHRANHFLVTLRDLDSLASADVTNSDARASLPDSVDQRISALKRYGFPNYLGPQRFGIGQRNLTRARQWFRNPRKRVSRQQRSLWLSAARSALFNVVCRARVGDDSWQELMQGEPAMLHGSNSFFVAESSSTSDATLTERLQRFDIHPSGPWWGKGASDAVSDCAKYEHSKLQAMAELSHGLERAGLPLERRALRCSAADLSAQWLDDGSLQLRFSLLPGEFATSLLNELGQCQEPARDNKVASGSA